MSRFIKTTLAISVLAFAAQSFATPAKSIGTPAKALGSSANVAVSPTERAKIESVVHDYLLSKPEILIQAMQVLQAKQYQQAEQTVKQTQQTASTFAKQLFNNANDPVAGNPNGSITVAEFFDYQCPHCVDMAPVLDGIIKANPDVRIVFKDFPIRGPISEFAARAALAANKQGKYYEFSHALLTSKTQPLTQDAVFAIATNLGLNVAQLKKDMNDSSIENQLKDNIKLAQDLKLFGTPAIFIGKTNGASGVNYFPGQVDQKQLQALIDKAKA